ncbi:hypothetical protein D8674_020376 [Pyrus ussuriensis x Pyrus communis]|uniref:Uncharacterized protein n=1 Tax=Pyrus ussuriensis x Pyrus communis TaxID=2448454 RepID=A0A5N5HGJ3_9ROSA|nr:hypothetical protein D8674_020376 [Pyrus ussuriensis x Pyrus communis]
MGTTGVLPVTPLRPIVSTILASSTSSVMHPVLSAQRTHRQPLKFCGGSAVWGVKVLEIDMFKEVYVRSKDEQTEQLHSTTVEKGQTVLEKVISQLPVETPIEGMNVHWGLWKGRIRDPSASSFRQRTEEVETLTSKVAYLKERIAAQQSQIVAQNNLMNQIHRAL